MSLASSGDDLGKTPGKQFYGADLTKYKNQISMDNGTFDSLATKFRNQITTIESRGQDRAPQSCVDRLKPPSLSAHFSPPKLSSFRAPPTTASEQLDS
jgi:hypothetical protein